MKLRIFDFDDTLLKTGSRIYITHNDGKKSALSPAEYAVYSSKAGDVFDYGDFDGDLISPASIITYNKIMRNAVNASGKRKIVILTARGISEPIKKYLKTSNIPLNKIEIVALGNSNPVKKKEWIENQIKIGYNDVLFFDDSEKNITEVNKLKKEYPNIKLKTHLVKETYMPTQTELNENYDYADSDEILIDIAEKVEDLLDIDTELTNLQTSLLQQIYYEMCELHDSINKDLDNPRERAIHNWDDDPDIIDHLGLGRQY